jgi:hypothetical protein
VGVSGGACYILALSRAACCLSMLLVGADVVAKITKRLNCTVGAISRRNKSAQ